MHRQFIVISFLIVCSSTTHGMEKELGTQNVTRIPSLYALAQTAAVTFLKQKLLQKKSRSRALMALDTALTHPNLPYEVELSLVAKLAPYKRYQKAIERYATLFLKKAGVKPSKEKHDNLLKHFKSNSFKRIMLERLFFAQNHQTPKKIVLKKCTDEIIKHMVFDNHLFAFTSDGSYGIPQCGNLGLWNLKSGKFAHRTTCYSPIERLTGNHLYLASLNQANVTTIYTHDGNVLTHYLGCSTMALNANYIGLVNDNEIKMVNIETKENFSIPLDPDIHATSLTFNESIIAARLCNKTLSLKSSELIFWQKDTGKELARYNAAANIHIQYLPDDLQIWNSLVIFSTNPSDNSYMLESIDITSGIRTVLFCHPRPMHSIKIFGDFACCTIGKENIFRGERIEIILINLNDPQDQRTFTRLVPTPTEKRTIWPVAILDNYLLVQEAKQHGISLCGYELINHHPELLIFNMQTGDHVHTIPGEFITCDHKTHEIAIRPVEEKKDEIWWYKLPIVPCTLD